MSEVKGRVVQHTRLEGLLEELNQETFGLTVRLDSRTRTRTYGGVQDCRVLIIVTACYETNHHRNPDTLYLWVAEGGFYQRIGNSDWGEYSREFVIKTVGESLEALKAIIQEKLKDVSGETAGVEVKQGIVLRSGRITGHSGRY
jgi:hypothetical protein